MHHNKRVEETRARIDYIHYLLLAAWPNFVVTRPTATLHYAAALQRYTLSGRRL